MSEEIICHMLKVFQIFRASRIAVAECQPIDAPGLAPGPDRIRRISLMCYSAQWFPGFWIKIIRMIGGIIRTDNYA